MNKEDVNMKGRLVKKGDKNFTKKYGEDDEASHHGQGDYQNVLCLHGKPQKNLSWPMKITTAHDY